MIYRICLAPGTCLGRALEGALATVDTTAPIFSGDLVEVLTRYQTTGVVASMTKQLEVTQAGAWFLTCLEGVMPLGAYYAPAAIHRIVALHPLPYPPPPNPPCTSGAAETEELLKFWDDESRAARFEWTHQGKPRGILFPGVEAALAAGHPPTDWPESFRLPPNYFPPERAA